MKRRIKSICMIVFVNMLLYVSSAWSSVPQQALWGKSDKPIDERFSVDFVPNEVLMKFKEEITQTKMQALHSYLRAEEIGQNKATRVRCIRLPENISVEEAIAHYEMDSNVDYAEPNYIFNYTAIPNDPAFVELWGLHNDGQNVNGVSGTPDADIDAPEAWDIATGSDTVIIAVVDSGVAYRHPEINPNIWVNDAESNGTKGVDDDNNGYVDDIYGWDFWADDNNPEDYRPHGTHVAGIIAARGNNSEAITGVNWKAKIMALRNGNIGASALASTDAIIYAVDNGADIINASWSGPNFSQSVYDAISYANDHGVLFVASAGNGGSDGIGDDNDQTPQYPASYDLPNIIAVAATDQNDNLTNFSNFGSASVDVAAPGENIYSTIPEFTRGTRVDLFAEDFDPTPSEWFQGGTNASWAFVAGTGDGGSDCLEDSPGGDYLNDTDSYVYFAGTGTPFSSIKDNLYTLSVRINAELENEYDFLLAGVKADTGINPVAIRTGSTGGAFINDSFDFTIAADLLDSFNFGFALKTDSSGTQDGVYIDNLEFYREPVVISSYSYNYWPGTSMASPQVAGVAGLVKAQNPSLTHLEIRDIILSTVDYKSSLSGKVLAEGRVNAFNAVSAAGTPPEPVVTSNGGAGG